jgi:hypothetical protein
VNSQGVLVLLSVFAGSPMTITEGAKGGERWPGDSGGSGAAADTRYRSLSQIPWAARDDASETPYLWLLAAAALAFDSRLPTVDLGIVPPDGKIPATRMASSSGSRVDETWEEDAAVSNNAIITSFMCA